MKPISVLPTLLTLGNVFCGFLAIAYTADALISINSISSATPYYEKLQMAAVLIFLAMVFDALDGRVARMTRLTSDFGGQLDSLCDAISFGLAPAFLAKVLVDYEATIHHFKPHPRLYFLAAAFFVICAVLRLARFNIENQHSEDAHLKFRGLPAPAGAGVIATTIILYCHNAPSFESSEFWALVPRFVLPLLLPLVGILMVSRLPFVHYLNYLLRGKKRFAFLTQFVLVLIVAAIEPLYALGLVFYGYMLSGPVLWLRGRFFPKTVRVSSDS